MNTDSVFKGKWICAREFAGLAPVDLFHREMEEKALSPHPRQLQDFHMLVKKEFTLQSTEGLLLRITADDYYKLYINGRYVGQGPAAGYYFAYYYNEYDLTPYVHSGKNEIFVDVYYQGLINRVWNSGDLRQGMIADLYQNSTLLLCTDSSWQYTRDTRNTDPVTFGYDTQFTENLDNRVCFAPYTDCAQKQADYTFAGATVPVQVCAVTPASQKPVAGGIQLDMGREYMGSLCVHAVGRAGDVLRVRCGEELDETGRVRYKMRCNCLYEDVFTLKDGENRFEAYDYKAFRYAELLPADGVQLTDVSMQVRHYPFDEAACTLQTDDTVLQNVFALCKNTMKYCTQEGFMDCPSREKGQYAGDLTITGATHMLLTGDRTLFLKAIQNQMQSARIAPGLLAVTPGSLMQEIADYSLQFPLLIKEYYTYTGDKAVLKAGAQCSKEICAYFAKYARPDGLLEAVTEKWNLVDWPDNLRDGYDFALTKPVGPGCHNVLNAFYVGCVKTTAALCSLAGIEFADSTAALTDAFNAAFLDKKTGIYRDTEHSCHSAMHSNAIAAFYGLYPESARQTVGDFLQQCGMRGGVYMAYFYLKALARLGRYDAVYGLITSRGENSWYNMLQQGATTLFEAWGKEKKGNCSLCHPWAAAPVPVLLEDLLGLTVGPDGEARWQPHLPAGCRMNLHLTLPNGKEAAFSC